MIIDHLLIFSSNGGQDADELADFGLCEGSCRIHPGQGTRNRKFYFENVFLEIVWVNDEREITSEVTAPTRLWERCNHQINGSSPFGICLANTHDSNTLFENCVTYRPVYLPEGIFFEIITNEDNPHLPWTCRLPTPGVKHYTEEPKNHGVGIKDLTNLRFGIKKEKFQNTYTELISEHSNIVFEATDRHSLTLEFDHQKLGRIKRFRDIPLTLKY